MSFGSDWDETLSYLSQVLIWHLQGTLILYSFQYFCWKKLVCIDNCSENKMKYIEKHDILPPKTSVRFYEDILDRYLGTWDYKTYMMKHAYMTNNPSPLQIDLLIQFCYFHETMILSRLFRFFTTKNENSPLKLVKQKLVNKVSD